MYQTNQESVVTLTAKDTNESDHDTLVITVRIEIYITGWILTQLCHIQLACKPKRYIRTQMLSALKFDFNLNLKKRDVSTISFEDISERPKIKNCEGGKQVCFCMN